MGVLQETWVPDAGLRGTARFIARQPIFDRSQNVVGYELLYRSGWRNSFTGDSRQMASRSMADTALLHGIDTLTAGKRAFINCGREDLLEGLICIFPPARIVVEILEDVPATSEVVEACRQLRHLGYQIALDDFTGDSVYLPLAELADIIKVDWLAADPVLRAGLPARFPQRKLLAEKVETPEQFDEAKQAGYHWFQGYFFERPRVLTVRDITPLPWNYIRALRAATQPQMDFQEVETSIKQEPSLLYRLLRYLNSALFGFRRPVASVSHALALLGEDNLRRWISVVCFAVMAGSKPQELVRTSLIRARFAESLAVRAKLGKRAGELFLLGLLSLMDALLDRPMEKLLHEIPVHPEVADALRGRDSIYLQVLETVRSYERGDWVAWQAAVHRLSLAESDVPPMFLESVEWADQALHACRVP